MSTRVAGETPRSEVSSAAGRSGGRRSLRDENLELRAKVEWLEAENHRLRDRLTWAQATITELRRAAKRQAAPFSRERKKPNPARGGRKPGAAYGPKARRLPPDPENVDETIGVGLPESCPDCGGQVLFDTCEPQFQEELVPAQRVIRCFEVALGHCVACRRPVRSRHPDQTSDALGAAGVMLGPRALALAAWLHIGCGVSMSKVSKILKELAGITVTPGGLVQALHRMADQAEDTYQALLTALRGSTAVSADETGWRVDGERAWLWVYVGDQVTVYDIARGRGYQDAVEILGADFTGVLERDGWASYPLFEHAEHQSCLAHLLRRCSELIGDSLAGQARIPHELRRILLDALNVRDQQLRGKALTGWITDLEKRLDIFCRHRPRHEPNRKLVNHVRRERNHLLTFLTIEGVQATNWRAEHGVRAMICNRKQWGGNKTWDGAYTTSTLGSVLRTAHQQDIDPIEALIHIKRTSQIPPQLTLTSGPSP